ncbi:MAG: hypothetical protein IAE87_17090 [Rhodobacteraceae bacterium]|nr:hypothetical protein [Paracoccaceae bacterium]
MRLSALVLTVCLPAAAAADEWFVIVSYVDHPPFEWADAALDRARYLDTALAPCGYSAWSDFVGKFDGFNPNGRGTVFIADAVPNLSKSQAEHVLGQVRPCVPDAYIKRGRYFGE